MTDNNIRHESEPENELFKVRAEKLKALRDKGQDPFRTNCKQAHTSAQAKSIYIDDESGQVVEVAGRLVVIRLMGKAAFVKILDRDGQIQLYFRRDEVGEEAYAEFKKLDLGDIIGAEGLLFQTKTGEITVRVKRYKLVSKALRPLPEKWHGLKDNEQIYRQRYLDLIANPESRERFLTRSRIVSRIRSFLEEREFIEVETPVLQGEAGGAAAQPFVTHFASLDCDFYLRIATELHLKRLLVAGFDRVFEIGRIFRNEGLSRRHNPEFTMLEVYEAYSDYLGMMDLVQNLILTVCRDVLGTTNVEMHDGQRIEFDGTWKRAKYKDLILEAVDDSEWFSRPKEEKLSKCRALGIEVNPELNDIDITNDVFEKRIEPELIQPTFVTHVPKELEPLAKISEEDPDTVEVFELCVGGNELAPAFSEQNDPFAQLEMFQAQEGEQSQKFDRDFIAALEHGMPPAGGMGLGIDRLCILLTGAANIRDTILFPSLRPDRD